MFKRLPDFRLADEERWVTIALALVQVFFKHDLQELALLAVGSHLAK